MKSGKQAIHQMAVQINGLKVVKIAAGSVLAVVLAGWAGLSYETSAGVITLLSIQNTKRETIAVVWKRALAFFIALVTAGVCFGLMGYRPLALGGFLLVFAGICNGLSFQDAIAMNTVLVTHFYVEQSMDWGWICNEALLLVIGAGIGVLMNLYMPGDEAMIRRDQRAIEEKMKSILKLMADMLLAESKGSCDGSGFAQLDEMAAAAIRKAEINRDNRLLSDTAYYLNYMRMRRNQGHILGRIWGDICLLDGVPGQTYPIAGFVRQIHDSFHEYNNARGLLDRLEEIKGEMKEEPLPVSRGEFENRAVLYRILYELEEFLELKQEFVMGLDKKEIQTYWKGL